MSPIIRVLWEDWADRDIPLPAYETHGAAGADIRANLPPEIREDGFLLRRMERRIVPTGLRVEIPSPLATDADLEERLDAIRAQHAELAVVERAAAEGDHVTIGWAAKDTRVFQA